MRVMRWGKGHARRSNGHSGATEVKCSEFADEIIKHL
ncbi:hypothetical protein SAMN06296416_1078 [Pseudoxanthomonas wuyuanensis]|uniref:Uncharacterized protein n=1 Tax=Pseudoxanthomonas wuyuanensis TaxID=1073196 RepID=A0A286D9M5_9GAMM|nr:hypothetical protein SAMN06296416_1078 [Pseudoxanthomonas wuyuanensis]